MKVTEVFDAVYHELKKPVQGIIFSINPQTHEMLKSEVAEFMPPPERINTYRGIPIEIDERLPNDRVYARPADQQ